ncbi:hypothetical protein HY407_04725 [Candidatus Gottesmanbacteria bacterium]|nr:hypothetical protein [Candidatus Gottesmanbacteria bacterium]
MGDLPDRVVHRLGITRVSQVSGDSDWDTGDDGCVFQLVWVAGHQVGYKLMTPQRIRSWVAISATVSAFGHKQDPSSQKKSTFPKGKSSSQKG